jgi:serine protease inhibitor
MYRAYIAVMIGCSAVITAGCSDSQRSEPPSERGSAQITELPRALTVSERAVIATSNGFGLELAARVTAADPRANVILSPLSASMALGMTLNGADGTTFDAMRSALGFDSLSREQVNGSYRDLIDLLMGLDPEVRFEIANAIWANEGIPFHDAFFEAVADAFDARAETRNFGDPATLAAINAWVEQNTGGFIERIVDSLDPALVALLVNAIYFDGTWTAQFDPDDTRRQAFTREDGSTVDIDMMSIENLVARRAHGSSYAAVELPYGGEAFSMVIVLPNDGTSARDWLSQLDADQWTALTDGLSPGRLDLLSIPKLKLTYDTYLNDALQSMGMDPAFRPVEVDERGTRAAAATAVGVGIISFNGFVVDRPFVFVIRERLSGALLFIGLVGDPTAADPGAGQLVSDCTGAMLP